MAVRTSTPLTNNVVRIPDSRYVQGGQTDVYPDRVGWWERRPLPKADSDFTIEIQPGEDRRPDLVAARVYGRTNLEWLVLQYNAIVDVETEFTTGTEIRLPTPRRVTLDLLSQRTGGNPVT